MKKLLMLSACMAYLSPAEASYGIYDIDISKIESFVQQGKEKISDNPIFQEFKSNIEDDEDFKKFKRKTLSIHYNQNLDTTLKTYFDAVTKWRTSINNERVCIDIWKQKDTESVNKAFLAYVEKNLHHYQNENFESFGPESAQVLYGLNGNIDAIKNHISELFGQEIILKQEEMDKIPHIKEDIASYNKLGPWRIHRIKGFVNATVLRVEDSIFYPMNYSMDDKKVFFNFAKESGFLTTSIEDLDQFKYDAQVSFNMFIENHPHVTNLVLACGHTRGWRHYEEQLKVANESQCGLCDEDHEGELTVGLSLANDNCDVVADMDTLNYPVNYFSMVKFHDGTAFNEELLKKIYTTLKPEGIFEMDSFSQSCSENLFKDQEWIDSICNVGFTSPALKEAKIFFTKK